MEKLSTIANNVAKRSSQPETSLTRQEPGTPLETLEEYQDRILPVVHDSFELSSADPPIAKLMSRAETWSRLLHNVVPVERVQEAFDRAFADHSSEFPVNAYEIKAAWDKIRGEESAARAKKRGEIQSCDLAYNHINEHGDVEIVLGGPNGKTVIIPCAECRTEHSYRRLAEEKQKFLEENPNFEPLPIIDESNVLEFVSQIAKTERRKPRTAIGLINQARLDGGDQDILDRIRNRIRAASQEEFIRRGLTA
jgi:hypothetical protein